MTSVLQKYKLVFVVLGLLAFISLLWFFLLRQDTNKIPSRGVFVMRQELPASLHMVLSHKTDSYEQNT